MSEPRILRCTVCGLTHEEHSDDSLITCDACGNQYLALDGIFLSQKTQKEIDTLANLRVRLSEMIKVNDAKMILSHAQDILKILPEDFLGSYFYAYGAYETRQPKFIYQFFKQSTFDTTPNHMRQVTAHMASYIDIKEYPLILNFIQAFDKDYISEAKKILKKRIQLEDQYSVIQRDVFICHRSTEYDTVLEVVRALEEDGFTCWYSERNLRPDDNENYWKNIEEAIDHSTLFLMISSQSAMLSKDVQRELQYANKQHKNKLEYKIDDSVHTTLFKHAFDGLKWIDASKEAQLHQLKQRVYANLHVEINDDIPKEEKNLIIDKSFNKSEFIKTYEKLFMSKDKDSIKKLFIESKLENPGSSEIWLTNFLYDMDCLNYNELFEKISEYNFQELRKIEKIESYIDFSRFFSNDKSYTILIEDINNFMILSLWQKLFKNKDILIFNSSFLNNRGFRKKLERFLKLSQSITSKKYNVHLIQIRNKVNEIKKANSIVAKNRFNYIIKFNFMGIILKYMYRSLFFIGREVSYYFKTITIEITLFFISVAIVFLFMFNHLVFDVIGYLFA